jgi:hypothetical protein
MISRREANRADTRGAMYRPLVPCPSCRRHVRTAETNCPFCAATLRDLDSRVIPNVTQRLSRGAVFVFASSLAVAGCGSDSTTTTTPPTDAQGDSTQADTSGKDTNGADVPADSPADTFDTGGVAPPYGIPADSGPPPDGGTD